MGSSKMVQVDNLCFDDKTIITLDDNQFFIQA